MGLGLGLELELDLAPFIFCVLLFLAMTNVHTYIAKQTTERAKQTTQTIHKYHTLLTYY